MLGFQSIAQVSGTYGREVADTLVENCGNTLILRCSASERGGTSEFASKLILAPSTAPPAALSPCLPRLWISPISTQTVHNNLQVEQPPPHMDRTYLYVPPEENAAVEAAGAHWDERLKCWYLAPGDDPAGFGRWLGADGICTWSPASPSSTSPGRPPAPSA